MKKQKKEALDLEGILKNYNMQIEVASEKIEKLLETEPWIGAEEPFFGKEGTMYDFRGLDLLQLTDDIAAKEAEQEDLKKKFDPRVEELAKKNQEMYSELERKRATILADKEKLEETIKKLDAERNKDVKKTVDEVSVSIGQIFGVLLPGTGARLNRIEDPEQDNAIVGLELKVSFGGVEKESLSELSGG